ncbi:hypothetical protein JT366_08575 [Sphingomonas paucimobilis]|uniref:phage protease n=1 Tax=Sphingomonas paucimobilis TaxID=13689 RepID=UPI0019644161|nr:phage protease [Sphingomonas paucimobilis]QRY97257.1 hypothetical protein JT366_08575 [Sphingomonas paucimobilis]
MTGTAIALCAALNIDATEGKVPEWVHLLPAGPVRTADGRGPYRVNDIHSIVSASMAGGKLVLDECHATDLAAPRGESAPARGWIVELQARADGVWGKVDWTPEGARLSGLSRHLARHRAPQGRHCHGDRARQPDQHPNFRTHVPSQ